MLHKTPGIVLNFIKYRDTSIIVKIYTLAFGVQTYIVNGVRGRSSKGKSSRGSRIALYQPLTLLDLIVYKKLNADINRISESKCSHPFHHIPFDVQKSGIAIFITEILSKTIKEETENPDLFGFLQQSILMLDHMEEHYENFHIQFLLKLSRYLGFAPQSAHEVFQQLHYLANNEELAMKEKAALDELMITGYDRPLKFNNSIRRDLLKIMIQFYKLHIESLGEIRSMQVLREVMR